MRPSVPDVHISDSQDAEYAAYRVLAAQSVVGFVFGLLAPLALIASMFWILPAAGVFFSVWALRRIARDASALTGRKLAWAGLFLSLIAAAAAPTDALVYRRAICGEARRFSALWFQYLTHDEPQLAYQLTVPPEARHPLDGGLWEFYRNQPKARAALEGYVTTPLVRTLLALGPRADVRFYQTAAQVHEDTEDLVAQWYAVTYEDEGEKKSFFVVVDVHRTQGPGGTAGWQIIETKGGEKPKGWDNAQPSG